MQPPALTLVLSDVTELTREGSDGPAPFRSDAITPDGFIEEDFEAEIGTPSVRFISLIFVLS